MDATSLTLEVTSVVMILATFGSLLKIHFSMEKKMALQNQQIDYLQSEYNAVKADFEKLENQVLENKDKVIIMHLETKQEIQNLTLEVSSSKNEILTAILNRN